MGSVSDEDGADAEAVFLCERKNIIPERLI